ncbi:unnamed protein product, partial [Tetraodon nigroviridis]
MSRRQRALLALVLLLWRVAAAHYSTRSEPDYDLGHYRQSVPAFTRGARASATRRAVRCARPWRACACTGAGRTACWRSSGCRGASAVAAGPTERCTAAFPTVRPPSASTPPMSPTTAAPSVGAVSLQPDG